MFKYLTMNSSLSNTLLFRTTIFSIIFIMLSSCASKQSSKLVNSQSIYQRTLQLQQLQYWKVNGKIAFIQDKKRESANLVWQVDVKNNNQKLNLNSYLGINVLHLESNNDQHVVEVDGKKYHSNDLDELIYSLTGMVLPTKALNFWLKGLPYLKGDVVLINKKSQLPEHLTSKYSNKIWEIDYTNYKVFNNIHLPTKLTIKTNNLTIKINVRNWHF